MISAIVAMTFALYCVFRLRKRKCSKENNEGIDKEHPRQRGVRRYGGRVNDIAMHATGETCIYP